MTWTGKTFNVGDILTAAQMNNLQADITAQANGDAGAPKQKWRTLSNSTEVFSSGTATPGTVSTSHFVFQAGVYNIRAQCGTDPGGGVALGIQLNIGGTNYAEELGASETAVRTYVVPNSGDLTITASGNEGSLAWEQLA